MWPLASLYLLSNLVAGAYYCSTPPSPDQSIFDYIAWQGIQGVQWYSGSFEMTWPGILLIHEIGIRLFGVHLWTARATDMLLLQAAILSIAIFLYCAGLRKALVIFVIVYPIIYVTSGPWVAGHRDIMAAHFLIASAAVALAVLNRPLLAVFVSGTIIGCAVLIRPTYLSFAPAIWIGIFYLHRRDINHIFSALLLCAGILLFPLIFAIAGWQRGTLDDWLTQTFWFVLEVYPVAEGRARLFGLFFNDLHALMLWLAFAGVLGALLWFGTRRLAVEAVMICGMFFTFVLSYLVQNKGFAYHLGGLIPLFLIVALTGAELGLISRKLFHPRNRWLIVGTSIAILFVIGLGTIQRIRHNILPMIAAVVHAGPAAVMTARWDADKLTAIEIIRRESGPDDRFIQWGWNYDVGFRSERLSGTRYMNVTQLSAIRPKHRRFLPWLNEFDRELSLNRPLFILLDRTVLPDGVQSDHLPIEVSPNASPALAILIAHVNKDYIVRASWPKMLLLKRKTL
jgi:hypothetical protein